MLSLILFILIITPLCWLYGRSLVRLLCAWLRLEDNETGLALTLLGGMVVITTVVSVLSLVMPLGIWSLGVVFLTAIPLLIREIKAGEIARLFSGLRGQPLPWLSVFLLLVVTLSILENATHQPVNPDSGIYHAQAIKWMENYPAVPGLGNLHSRFAYNSSWLVLNAAFSLAFLGLQSFRFIPAVLFLAAAFEFVRGASAWLRANASPAHILRTLLLPVSFYVLGSQTSSPGTDLPVILMLWILVPAAVEAGTRKSGKPAAVDLLIALTAVFLVTVKLSAVPLLLLAAWMLLRSRLRAGAWLKAAFLAALILLPWAARNLILSGYLVYPLPALDFFSFDWKIPLENARSEQAIILAWARIPNQDAAQVLSMPLQAWLKVWFSALTRNQQFMVLTAGISPILMLVEYVGLKINLEKRRAQFNPLFTAYGIVLAGGMYWLLSAPDLRFGYGFVVLLLLFPLVIPLQVMLARAGAFTGALRFALVVFLLLYQLFFLLRSIDWATVEKRLLLPADYPHHASEPCPIENAVVLCANEVSYTQCWYNPFPCIPKPVDNVYLRGEDWRSGFRHARPGEQQHPE